MVGAVPSMTDSDQVVKSCLVLGDQEVTAGGDGLRAKRR